MGSSAGGQYQNNFLFAQKQLQSLLGKAPNSTPDLSDPSVQAARQTQILNAQLMRGRKGSFLQADQGGSYGDSSIGNKQLLGE